MSEWTDRLAAELQSLRSENAQLRAECGDRETEILQQVDYIDRLEVVAEAARDLMPLLTFDDGYEIRLRKALEALRPSTPAERKPEHLCGLQGYNPMLGDRCPACEYTAEREDGKR